MKTPLDNFEFTQEVFGNEIRVEAVHKTLGTCFARKYSWSVKQSMDKNQQLLNTTIRVVQDIIRASIYGVAQVFENPNFEQMGVGPRYLHHAEWDKEKEAWFILDENNNKVYE